MTKRATTQVKNPAPHKKKKYGQQKWVPNEKDFQTIEALSQRGLNSGIIGSYFGYSGSWWCEMKKRNPIIDEKIASGRAKGISFVFNKLWKMCEDGDQKAIFYFLDKVGGLRQAPTIEINNTSFGDTTNTNNIQFNIGQLDDQALKLLASQTSHLLDSKGRGESNGKQNKKSREV